MIDQIGFEPIISDEEKSDVIPYDLSEKKIVVMDNQECIFLKIQKISYIAGEGSYSTIYLRNGKKFVVSKNIKDFVGKLNTTSFFRIHKSYLINVNCIDKYVKTDGGYLVMKNGGIIPVSVRKKYILSQLVKNLSL